ncbi:MAG: ParA family protein [Opitutaceae bacterium]|nr:ParA family protein [Opitutaceae bacterium]
MVSVAFVNGKGGTGKTTLCMCVAMALSESGKKIAVADRDPQGTTIGWLRRIQSEDRGPWPYDANTECDILLIDTPPRLNEPAVRDAILGADKVIIVTTPSPVDLETTARTALDFVLPLRRDQHPEDPRVALVFNQVQTGTLLSRSLAIQAGKVPGVRPMAAFVRRRQCYQQASMQGWAGLNLRAQEELVMLIQEIFSF